MQLLQNKFVHRVHVQFHATLSPSNIKRYGRSLWGWNDILKSFSYLISFILHIKKRLLLGLPPQRFSDISGDLDLFCGRIVVQNVVECGAEKKRKDCDVETSVTC